MFSCEELFLDKLGVIPVFLYSNQWNARLSPRLNPGPRRVGNMAEPSKRTWPWKKKFQDKAAPESSESSPRDSPHNSKFFDELVCSSDTAYLVINVHKY